MVVAEAEEVTAKATPSRSMQATSILGRVAAEDVAREAPDVRLGVDDLEGETVHDAAPPATGLRRAILILAASTADG